MPVCKGVASYPSMRRRAMSVQARSRATDTFNSTSAEPSRAEQDKTMGQAVGYERVDGLPHGNRHQEAEPGRGKARRRHGREFVP